MTGVNSAIFSPVTVISNFTEKSEISQADCEKDDKLALKGVIFRSYLYSAGV
jgi:hypothetical protein